MRGGKGEAKSAMGKTKNSILDFPEEVSEEGIKIYGETSYENQMAVLSHYLHNKGNIISQTDKEEIISALKAFLEHKQFRQSTENKDLTDDEILMAAEPQGMFGSLFDDFFKVPFPAPDKPKFTFIDLFAGIGGFRMALQNCGGECVFSSEWDESAKQTYFANYGEVPFGDITSPNFEF